MLWLLPPGFFRTMDFVGKGAMEPRRMSSSPEVGKGESPGRWDEVGSA